MKPIYERYRPRTFDDVIGQEKALETCRKLAARGLGGLAIWVAGPSGTGKTTLARILAAEIADRFFTVEIDAGDATMSRLRDIEAEMHYTAFGKGGRAYIINEAHGLTAQAMRKLLVMLESVPEHCLFVFTTTGAGQQQLFDDHTDTEPLLSRCIRIALTNQGLCGPFAEHVRAIATREGMNGKPLAAYERLARQHHNNMRAMFEAVEAGDMASTTEG